MRFSQFFDRTITREYIFVYYCNKLCKSPGGVELSLVGYQVHII